MPYVVFAIGILFTVTIFGLLHMAERRRIEELKLVFDARFNTFSDDIMSQPKYQSLLRSIESLPDKLKPIAAERAYQRLLDALIEHPDAISLRMWALETGRISKGSSRDVKVPTIYDEQAIQNDILVRTRQLV